MDNLNNTIELKTSDEWCKHVDIELGNDIIDPDGWDRTNLDYSFYKEKINYNTFLDRVTFSTCMMTPKLRKILRREK